MDNFEDRYRTIVEKEQTLRHRELEPDELGVWLCKTGNYFALPTPISREAVCWWLEEKLPDDIIVVKSDGLVMMQRVKWDRTSHNILKFPLPPMEAILTAWEIILGIKEKP